ncbi:MAG: threonine/serine exporter family protein, partial [Nocardioidaceae bacterium]
FEALLLTGGVIAGITMTLTVAQNFGVTMEVSTSTGGLSDLPMQLLGSLITTIAFAVSAQVPRLGLIGCGIVGLLAQMLYQLSIAARLGPTAATAIAAFGVGLVAFAVAARVRIPPLVIVSTAIIALLPGFTIYKGLFTLLNENLYGITLLITAASIAVALASGAILGEYVAQPLAREARRLETRLAGPRLVGPLRPVPRRTQRKARRALQKQIQAEAEAEEPAGETVRTEETASESVQAD